MKLLQDSRGQTTLETAIVLIAFIVVASVFAFTILSAGQAGQPILGTATAAAQATSTPVIICVTLVPTPAPAASPAATVEATAPA